MYFSNDIAEKIKNLAKKKNIKLSDLFENTNLGRNTMANLKTSMPKADNLAKIADYLNCSVDYLLGRTDVVEVNLKTKRLNDSELHIISKAQKSQTETSKKIILPLFENSASAGTGLVLFDDVPATYITVERNEKTQQTDFLINVKGDSMIPLFNDGDVVLVKKSSVISEGNTGIFILNGEVYIKKMGRGELVSLNPAYKPIKLNEYDNVSCAGIVIDKIILNNYT